MITVLGSSGFIGSHLVERLRELELAHFSPGRNDDLPRGNLGDIIYCVGVGADFRTKPLETVDAHVCNLIRILRECEFDSFLYLSSVRLYQAQVGDTREELPIQVAPLNPTDLMNISKAMGESLLFNCGEKTRVARLSSVYGGDFASRSFLSAVLNEATSADRVTLRTSLDAERDYISIDDTVDALIKIATEGRYRLYNVASGANVSNRELTQRISELTGCRVEVVSDPSETTYPQIDINRLREEFGFTPVSILDDMDRLVESYRRYHSGRND
jgi:nucleoside-diphosphate-sugar epimerase